MTRIYLIGHRNPDTDSVASAIAYAGLKQQVDPDNEYVPGKLGPINRETRYVLERFGVSEPETIENVFTEIHDIEFDPVVSVSYRSPISQVWDLMGRKGVRTVVVTDEGGRLAGVVTLGDIAKAHLESSPEFRLRPVPLDNLAASLGAEVALNLHGDFSGRVITGDVEEGSLSLKVSLGDLVISGLRPAVWREALERGATVLVVTGCDDLTPVHRQNLSDLAQIFGAAVLLVKMSTYEAIRMIGQSEPVSSIMTKEGLVTFSPDDLVDDVKEVLAKHKFRAFPVVNQSGEAVGMLSRRHVLDYARKKVILVDHNERSQSVEGLEEATILEIIDHHRLGAPETDQPIVFINEPLGCTATIVHRLYERAGLIPKPDVAGIMCSAILSDTLEFKSPTCTAEDMEAARCLADIAQVDLGFLAKGMFEAGTSVEGKTPAEIFYADFKEFWVGECRIGVAQVNTYNTDLGAMRAALRDFMERERSRKGYNLLVLMVTDVVNQGSEFVSVGNRLDVIERAFGVDSKTVSKGFFRPGVMSRKKQVIPNIVRAVRATL